MTGWSDRDLKSLIDSAFNLLGSMYVDAVWGLVQRDPKSIQNIFVYFLRKGVEHSDLPRDKVLSMLKLFQDALAQVTKES